MLQSLRSVFVLHDAPWRWGVGVEAAIAVALPLAGFTFVGQQSLGLIASLGAFTALYCAALPTIERLKILPFVMLGMVAASAWGVFCSVHPWLNIAGLVVVTALACRWVLGHAIGPPGPLLFVLVAGVSGYLAARMRRFGAPIEPHMIPLLAAIGALMAYMTVIAPLIVPSVRRRASRTLREIFPSVRFDPGTRLIAIRLVIAVIVAGLVGVPLGGGHPYWVVLTAVAVLQMSHTPAVTMMRAVQRVLGTVLGLGIFGALAMARPAGWSLVALIALLQFAIEVVVARNYGLALIFITPLAMTISTVGRVDNLFPLVRERMLDTLLGAAVALAVLWASEAWRRHRRVTSQAL